MATVPAPHSAAKRAEYEQMLATCYEEQKQAMARRIVQNETYARTTTQKLLEEFRAHQADEAQRLADPNSFYVPAESNFFIVILVRSTIRAAPKPRKVLELLRLKRIHNAVIIKNNESTRKMLQLAKDYIAYGTADYELLRRVIYTRGHGKIGHSKVKLTNEAIEQAFNGRFRCIEELVNVIYFGKEGMKEVCNFLYPMSLNSPLGGHKGRKNVDFLKGGALNNHRELLGNLLGRMLD